MRSPWTRGPLCSRLPAVGTCLLVVFLQGVTAEATRGGSPTHVAAMCGNTEVKRHRRWRLDGLTRTIRGLRFLFPHAARGGQASVVGGAGRGCHCRRGWRAWVEPVGERRALGHGNVHDGCLGVAAAATTVGGGGHARQYHKVRRAGGAQVAAARLGLAATRRCGRGGCGAPASCELQGRQGRRGRGHGAALGVGAPAVVTGRCGSTGLLKVCATASCGGGGGGGGVILHSGRH